MADGVERGDIEGGEQGGWAPCQTAESSRAARTHDMSGSAPDTLLYPAPGACHHGPVHRSLEGAGPADGPAGIFLPNGPEGPANSRTPPGHHTRIFQPVPPSLPPRSPWMLDVKDQRQPALRNAMVPALSAVSTDADLRPTLIWRNPLYPTWDPYDAGTSPAGVNEKRKRLTNPQCKWRRTRTRHDPDWLDGLE